METYLNENFVVKSNHSLDEALQRCRDLYGFVTNPMRRFRFTANLSKRNEVAAMRRTNQEKLRIAVLVSQAAFQLIQGATHGDYVVPVEVKAAGFNSDADEVGSIGGHELEKLRIGDLASEAASQFMQGAMPGDYDERGFVKNPKWSFRFIANLFKRNEAADLHRTDQDKLRIAVLASKAAFQFILIFFVFWFLL